LRIGSVTDIAIRRASASDAAALAALGRETFTETFGHLYPPKDLAGSLDAAHAPQHYADVARDPAFALWIAEADGRAVAYAEAGRCLIRHADVTPDCGELQRLYVRREAQGGGLKGPASGAYVVKTRRLAAGVASRPTLPGGCTALSSHVQPFNLKKIMNLAPENR